MDSFECAVCLEQLNDPRVISCGHTFCKSCLQKLKPNQLMCPLCRRTFESVDSLPSNFVVLKWMNETKQTSKKKHIVCQNCDSDTLAVVWCDNCESYYCAGCDSQIHMFKATKSHIRVGLKEKSKRPTLSKCTIHKRDNEIYCLDCQSLMCTICVIDNHKQHNVKSVSKCAEEKRVELISCVSPFQNLEAIVNEERELRLDKEKNVKELESIERRAQLLKNLIIQNDVNLQQITNRKEKIKTTEIVLINSIQEMGDMDLLDKENIVIMKRKIQDVLQEVYPEGRFEKVDLVWQRYGNSIQVTNQKKTAISSGSNWLNSVVVGSIPMSEGTYYWELRIDNSTDDMYGISQQISEINCQYYYNTKNGFFIHHSSDIFGNVVGNKNKTNYSCKVSGTIVGFELSIASQKILKVFKNGSFFSEFDVSHMELPLFPAIELYDSGAQCTITKCEKR